MLLPQPDNASMIPQGDERKLIVQFSHQAVQNTHKSLQEGRPIFDEVLFVEIMVPGDKNNIVHRKARDEDLARFPVAYQRFQRGQAVAQSGTPIDHWPALTVREVAELKSMNIATVEQLAELPDGLADKSSGLRTYRKQAIAYLAAAKDGALVQRQAVEIEKRDEQIANLRAEVKLLADRLEQAIEGRPARGPKREAAAA